MRSFTPASGIAVSEYLASSVGNIFDSGTIDADTASTTDSNSEPYMDKGVVLARITSPAAASGLVGPYSPTATDGRQLTYGIVGINDTFADLSEGDVDCGILVKGTVYESKVVMGSADGALPPTYKELLRTSKLDITFK
jgi:hypothetical protein